VLSYFFSHSGQKNIGFIGIPTSLRFLQSGLGVWPSFSANAFQSAQLALILDSTAVGEGFFPLVFLRGVGNREWRRGVTQKQAEENRARGKVSVG
jgi:hypothetical protein